jgi:N-acetylmuramoyl-L-alanine amidase
MIVAVDPGHGGHNHGARSPSGLTREEDLTLAVGQAVQRLRPTTILTRTCDQTISYSDRGDYLRLHNVALVIALHYDSTPWAPTKKGLHGYYARGNVGMWALARFAVANAPSELRGGTTICAHDDPLTNRDDWKKHAEYLCDGAYQPIDVLLLELGYLSNLDDLRYVIRTDGIDEQAALVVQCIEHHEGARHDAR